MKYTLEESVPPYVEIIHSHNVRRAYIGGKKMGSAVTDEDIIEKVRSYLADDVANIERKQRENSQ
jgi:hypothetical protein